MYVTMFIRVESFYSILGQISSTDCAEILQAYVYSMKIQYYDDMELL